MQKILITGAAGDVGSRLTTLLRDTYRLRLSDVRIPAGLKADADFVAADLADRAAVERAVAGGDGVGWRSGCGPKTSRNWCASVSNTRTSATRYSTAPRTTNGPGGTMPRLTVTATGRSFARKIFAMPRSPPMPGCRTTRSVTGTRGGPSAATNIAATSRPSISSDGTSASCGRSILRPAAQCAETSTHVGPSLDRSPAPMSSQQQEGSHPGRHKSNAECDQTRRPPTFSDTGARPSTPRTRAAPGLRSITRPRT